MQSIEQRTFELTHDLATAMAQLRHKSRRPGGAEGVSCGLSEGVPLCIIYGRHFEAGVSSKTQGTYCVLWLVSTACAIKFCWCYKLPVL